MKIRQFFVILTVVSALVLATLGVAQGQEVTLRSVSAFPKQSDLGQDFLRYIGKVNREGKGVVQISFLGGPEVTPAREQGGALARGVFDVLFGTPNYYTGIFAEAPAFSGLIKSAGEIRRAGGAALIDEALGRRVNAKHLAFMGGNVGLYIFLRSKPKRTPDGGIDLSGIRLRSSPLYRAFFKTLGATSVVLPGREIYTALERGIADGLGWNLMGVRTRGWNKFLKYRLGTPMYLSSLIVTINRDKWRSLPRLAQRTLLRISEDYEQELESYYLGKQKEEMAALKKAGMITVELPKDAAKKFQRQAFDASWSRIKANKKIQLDFGAVRRSFHTF